MYDSRPWIHELDDATHPVALRARWVLPMNDPPLEGGWITCYQGRIVDLGARQPDLPERQRRDLGDVVLMPGLVNPHVHLEFSSCERPLGQRGMGFADWIREVFRWKRQRTDAAVVAHAVARGLAEASASGTVFVGEIATDWPAVEVPPSGPTRGIRFQELLGLSEVRVDRALSLAQESIASFPPAMDENHSKARAARWRGGLSPHAPYSTHPRLVAGAATIARENRLPLAMHLAETREELRLLDDGTGPLRELLDELGVWREEAFPVGTRTLDYLQQLADAPRALVIHGNYLTVDEIDFLAARAATMSLVYCPRTHDYFEHERYPLLKLIKAGVRMALGTDGRGSTPDLNLLAEARFAQSQHPEVAPEQLLRMITCDAAKALGIAADYGSLAPGRLAEFLTLPIQGPIAKKSDPHALALSAD